MFVHDKIRLKSLKKTFVLPYEGLNKPNEKKGLVRFNYKGP